MKSLEIDKLNELYRKAESCDKAHFSEMKSNVLLVNSEHYKKLDLPSERTLDGNRGVQNPKVRITKNLIAKITSRIQNGILGLSPDLKPFPANASELQDKKAAELFDSVLQYGKERYKLTEKKEDWCADFVDIGEVAVKVYWDPNKGDLKAYKQKLTSSGEPLFVDGKGVITGLSESLTTDLMTGMVTATPHEPLPDKEKPIFSGDFVFETIFPANLMRCPDADSMDESPYFIVRKTMTKDKAKELVAKDDPQYDEKVKYIQESSEQKFRVFDHNTHSFEDSNGLVMIREYYYRPCYEYPNGYFYLTTEFGKIAEGELPYGVFPIAWRGYKKKQTSPRAHSVIKIARPYQVELNRASSKEVETQLVHGDDKVFTPPGTKLTQEATAPGIRQIKSVGTPTIIEGRVGSQYAPYIQSTIEQMFFAVDEDVAEDQANQLDPVALLYRSIRRNQRYAKAAREFQSFLKDVYWIYLRLAKQYFDDTWVIRAVGRREAVNLPEFRSAEEISVQLKLEESNEDAESKLGRYLVLQSALQYAGKSLKPEDLANLLVNLPFVNNTQIFNDLVADQKNVENDILALDRGEPYQADQDANHELYIKKLTVRIKSPDFKALAPMIQQNFMQAREQHRQLVAQANEKIMMAKNMAIPTDGNLVKMDFYVMKDGKQVRATAPYKSLEWMLKQLEQIGLTQESLGNMAITDASSISEKMVQMAQAQQPPQQQQQPIQSPIQGGMNGNGTNNTFN